MNRIKNYLKRLTSQAFQKEILEYTHDELTDQHTPKEFWNTILKIGLGKLFKGHTCQFYYYGKEGTKGSLSLSQQYFAGTVTASFNLDTNITTTTYTLQKQSPKWLIEKIKDISNLVIGGKITHSHPTIAGIFSADYNLVSQTNPKFNFWPGSITLEYIEIIEGCSFSNHAINIKELKKLTEHLRNFRNKVKRTDVNEIATFCRHYKEKGHIIIDAKFIN